MISDWRQKEISFALALSFMVLFLPTGVHAVAYKNIDTGMIAALFLGLAIAFFWWREQI